MDAVSLVRDGAREPFLNGPPDDLGGGGNSSVNWKIYGFRRAETISAIPEEGHRAKDTNLPKMQLWAKSKNRCR